MKNADMPAMPQYAWNKVAEKFTATGGLTKREAFAMAAMQGLLSSSKIIVLVPTDSSVVLESIKVADALLAALEVSNER